MSDEILRRDENSVVVLGAITDDANQEIRMVRVDPATNRILASTTGSGTGSVTSVSVTSANGFAGTVATATTTPAITISTSITGILKGNGTAISAVTIGSGLSFDGTTLSASGGGSGITIGTTTITSGTNTRILYNNSGVVGEYTLAGSGTVVAMATAPTFTTRITVPEIVASGSGGIDIHNNSAVQVAIFGAGGGTGTSLVGTTNIGSASADYIQITGGTGASTFTATGSSTNINVNIVPKGVGLLQAGGVTVPTISSTNTLTNKRITQRVTTITSSATPTVNTDNCDCVTITALATAITSMTTNLSGTPSNFDKLTYRIKDDGTGRAITWGASFASRGATLPTTTTANKVTYVGFIWNSVASTWDCVATGTEA